MCDDLTKLSQHDIVKQQEKLNHAFPVWDFNSYIKDHWNTQMTAALNSIWLYDFNTFFRF